MPTVKPKPNAITVRIAWSERLGSEMRSVEWKRGEDGGWTYGDDGDEEVSAAHYEDESLALMLHA